MIQTQYGIVIHGIQFLGTLTRHLRPFTSRDVRNACRAYQTQWPRPYLCWRIVKHADNIVWVDFTHSDERQERSEALDQLLADAFPVKQPSRATVGNKTIADPIPPPATLKKVTHDGRCRSCRDPIDTGSSHCRECAAELRGDLSLAVGSVLDRNAELADLFNKAHEGRSEGQKWGMGKIGG